MKKLSQMTLVSGKGWIAFAAALLSAFGTVGHACIIWERGETPDFGVLYYIAVFLMVFSVLYAILTVTVVTLEAPRGKTRGCKTRENKLYEAIFEKHPIILPTIIMLTCWLPWMIIAYPGTTDPNDTLDQLQQWHHIASYSAGNVVLVNPECYVNNHHPILHTILLNVAIDIGAMLHSQNAGMFGFVCVQEIILALALSMTLLVMREFGTSKWIRVTAICIYSTSPVYGGWALSVTKDVLFTAFFIVFVSMISLAAYRGNDNPRVTKLHLLLFFLSSIMVCLLRNNGIISVAAILILIPLLRNRNNGLWALEPIGLASLAASLCIILVVYPSLGFSGSSPREALSVPIQQTSRYIVEHGDEVTQSERESIDAILPYEEIVDKYNPGISDPVKNLFKKESSDKIPKFLFIWVGMGMKHPGTYFRAFAENTYLYYLPGQPTGWLWLNLNHYRTKDGLSSDDSNEAEYLASGFNLIQKQDMKEMRDLALQAYLQYRRTPFVSLPGDMAFCVWVLIAAAILLVRRHKFDGIAPLIPLLVLFAVVLLGPQNGNIRYVLPIIYTMPLTVALLVRGYR